jgi:transposase InsO family protein
VRREPEQGDVDLRERLRGLARELDVLIHRRGKPAMIVSDNGTEMTSRAMLKWSNRTGVEWRYIAPGNPQQTASSKASTASCATSA